MLSISNYTNPQIKSVTKFLQEQINITNKQQILVENTFRYYKNNMLMNETINTIRSRIELLSIFLTEFENFSSEITEFDDSKLDDFKNLFDFTNLNNLQQYIYSGNWNKQIFKPDIVLSAIGLILDWKIINPIPEYTFNFINLSNKYTSVDAIIDNFSFNGSTNNTPLFKRKSISGSLNVSVKDLVTTNKFIFDFKKGILQFLYNDLVIGEFRFPPDVEYRGNGKGFFKERIQNTKK